MGGAIGGNPALGNLQSTNLGWLPQVLASLSGQQGQQGAGTPSGGGMASTGPTAMANPQTVSPQVNIPTGMSYGGGPFYNDSSLASVAPLSYYPIPAQLFSPINGQVIS